MRVLVIGDHNSSSNHEFAVDVIAQAWKLAAPQVVVSTIAFASESHAVLPVWQRAAASQGGFENTTVIPVGSDDPLWQTRCAQMLVQRGQLLMLELH